MTTEYHDFTNVIFSNFIFKKLEYIDINNYFINIKYNKKYYWNLIYNLKIIKPKILKTKLRLIQPISLLGLLNYLLRF